jgi:hypothetical protein
MHIYIIYICMYIYNKYVYICWGLRRVCDGDLPCAAPQAQSCHREKKHFTIAAERQMLGGIEGGHSELSEGSYQLSKKNVDAKASDSNL